MPLLSKQGSRKTGQAICNGVYQCVIRRWAILASGLLFSVMLVLHIASLRHKELTTDEPLHYKYGYRVLHGTPRRTAETDSSTMPFSSLHAMTSDNIAIVATSLGFSVDKSWAGQIKRGRYATIALSLLLALYVLRWSYALYGYKGGLLSLSLYVLDPNFLAHGQLVTADVAAALMTTVALYYFWQFLKLGGKGPAFLSAMTLGLSQLAKYSCVYLYPIFLLLAPIYCSLNRTTAPAVSSSPQTMVNSVRHWSFVIALFIAVNIIIINVGFKFDGAGTPLSKYTFKDGLFKTLQGTPIIASLPLPLPIPYLQGLDLCKFEEKMGKAWGNIYMAGRLRVNYHNGTLHGFPGYYFYAAFFKVPIATQIIFLEIGRASCRERV